MPIHDWTRVSANTFHGFHLAWIGEMRKALNNGILPEGYYADAEQVTGRTAPDVLALALPPTLFEPPSEPTLTPEAAPATRVRLTGTVAPKPRQRRLVVRELRGHRVVALVEIVSRANKDRPGRVRAFTNEVAAAVGAGIHVVVLDILPPGLHDPDGMHAAVWRHFSPDGYRLPADEPLTVASYAADPPEVTAYVEHRAVGSELPTAPLFLTPRTHVGLPLAATYAEAWAGTPPYWRAVLEGPVR